MRAFGRDSILSRFYDCLPLPSVIVTLYEVDYGKANKGLIINLMLLYVLASLETALECPNYQVIRRRYRTTILISIIGQVIL